MASIECESVFVSSRMMWRDVGVDLVALSLVYVIVITASSKTLSQTENGRERK